MDGMRAKAADGTSVSIDLRDFTPTVLLLVLVPMRRPMCHPDSDVLQHVRHQLPTDRPGFGARQHVPRHIPTFRWDFDALRRGRHRTPTFRRGFGARLHVHRRTPSGHLDFDERLRERRRKPMFRWGFGGRQRGPCTCVPVV